MRTFYSFWLRHDGDLVISLANELQALGYYPTIPINRHIRVHHWRSRLVEALRKSDAAVVLLSPASLTYSYVMGELYAANISGLNEIQYDSDSWEEALAKIRSALERELGLPEPAR